MFLFEGECVENQVFKREFQSQDVIYTNSTILDGTVSVTWSIDVTTQVINFTVSAQTAGWIGMGFSTTGMMYDSDLGIDSKKTKKNKKKKKTNPQFSKKKGKAQKGFLIQNMIRTRAFWIITVCVVFIFWILVALFASPLLLSAPEEPDREKVEYSIINEASEPTSFVRPEILNPTSAPNPSPTADPVQYISGCKNMLPFRGKRWAFVSMLSTDGDYFAGMVKLGNSFLEYSMAAEEAQRIVIVIENRVSETKLTHLQKGGWDMCVVELIPAGPGKQPFHRFVDQFTKLWVFSWELFEKVVYMDADFIVLGSLRPLFMANSSFGAVRDFERTAFTTSFNAGMLTLKPSQRQFSHLMALKDGNTVAYRTDMAEQGFLNEVYKGNWTEFPFAFNANLAVSTNLGSEAWRKEEAGSFGGIRAIHYTMVKPFLKDQPSYPQTQELLDVWHDRSSGIIQPHSLAIILYDLPEAEIAEPKGAWEKGLAKMDGAIAVVKFWIFTRQATLGKGPVRVWIDPDLSTVEQLLLHEKLWQQHEYLRFVGTGGKNPISDFSLTDRIYVKDRENKGGDYWGPTRLILDLWRRVLAQASAPNEQEILLNKYLD